MRSRARLMNMHWLVSSTLHSRNLCTVLYIRAALHCTLLCMTLRVQGKPALTAAETAAAAVAVQRYRPLAQLRIAVLRGRALLSDDLGLPGSAYVRIAYIPHAALPAPPSGGKLSTMHHCYLKTYICTVLCS
jgi:hypothetical protein